MATYKQGSKSEEVRKIQRALGIKDDGIFGSQTKKAVEDYQRSKNLIVDGIVGNQTWTSLFGDNISGTGSYSSSTKTADWLTEYERAKPVYQQSPALTDAANMLMQREQARPGDYQSKYGDQIQSLLDQILNREKFSYDFNADPLYQQYANQYQTAGKLAMQDTMGNAALLSGGYGNSYAQTAGQQVYNGYMQELNNIIPELYQLAYESYQNEGNELRSNLGTLQGLDESDYGRYRDDVSDYYNDLNYYYNKYNDMSDREYNRYLHDVDAWEKDRAYWYGKEQDSLAQSNWEKEFALAASKAKGSGAKSENMPYSQLIAYLDDLHAGGEPYDVLLNELSGLDIPKEYYERAKEHIAFYPKSAKVPAVGTGGTQKPSLPTTFGYGIATPNEFENDRELKKKHTSYYEYLVSKGVISRGTMPKVMK